MYKRTDTGVGKTDTRPPTSPGIFIHTPERSPDDAANDPFMLLTPSDEQARNRWSDHLGDGSSLLYGLDAQPTQRRHTQPNPNFPNGHAGPVGNGRVNEVENRCLHLLLTSVFRDLGVPLTVRLWTGETLTLGRASGAATAPFTVWIRHPRAVRALTFAARPLRLADAYFRNELDIVGDFDAALRLRHHLEQMRPSLLDRVSGLTHLMRWSLLEAPAQLDRQHMGLLDAQKVTRHNRRDNQRAIAFHYDVSNAFYALWLDRRMVYSCAYFRRPDDTLEQAQLQKLDHICRKLMLRPGDRLLDVGCGWGALALHAARHYGAQVHGITLSHAQWEWANAAVRQQGLQGQVQIDLCDYRDLTGDARYDKVSSVGMFEHVGLRNLPLYFATLNRVLKPGGLMLNHGIAHEQPGWGSGLSSRFINRYVFPDGQLDAISRVQCVIEQCGFEIHDLENLRPHYVKTLRHWVQRLEACHDDAVQHVSEATWRIWRLFMTGSAQEFESGQLGVYQILAMRRSPVATWPALTREHVYSTE